ncbi:hypothetical protein I5591_14195 [Pseudomonas syringae pv. tomato]|uniref:Integral membrane protein n=5 Tax=Pseudomonas syringae group TaxID=136849 RepID=A0AAW4DZV4_PSESX|nr:hypothetical protein XJ28_15980 [Pseudomonas syringae pv. tomato]EGH94493.1 hypothetical protein PLA106_01010 [Pseudomonas amygdali pv. lachrymans str. M302278]KPB91242.1 Uncharacterized protein AC503_0027 [Pseudomonas syringae pv. maculicola]KPC10788.1 Uncharacterized protein AC500_0100 [Pseudomonas amygdali pv. lachrymans]KPC12201.1 Uncharacterized protein AC506_1079 [Pseudomonas syringae pv. maculicola str. M6]KPW36194.1 Integral membrane protein [Pseudomonas syringae pv. apii]KPW50240.
MLYWLVILSTSTAGTTMSDFMDRTLGHGYVMGSTVLIAMLIDNRHRKTAVLTR